MAPRTVIGVVGSDDPADAANARRLGALLAQRGWVVLTGGRNSGVMAAATAGAREAGGLTVGILPDARSEVAPGVEIAVVTDLGNARNNLVGLSSRALVACGVGGPGTASELALALKNGKRVILLGASAAAVAFFRELSARRVQTAGSPEEAVELLEREIQSQPQGETTMAKATKLGGLEVGVEKVEERLREVVGTTFADLEVSAADGYQVLPRPLELAGSHDFDLGAASLSLGGTAACRVAAFNGADDLDPDGLVAVPAGGAWLKIELEAAVEAHAAGSSGAAGFGLDAGAGARLLDYRPHRAADRVVPAVLAALAGARFAVRMEDVAALEAGEVLAAVFRGTLDFAARVTYGEALGASVAALDGVLGVAGASAFTVGAGATLELQLSASDDFRLVFRRGAEGRVAVDVRKAEARRAGAQAQLGVEAAFRDPGQLAGLVEAYAAGRLGAPWSEVQELLARLAEAPDLDSLGPFRQLAEAVAERLGVGDLQNRLSDLRERLEGLPEKLAATLRDVLGRKVALAFTFSYTRVRNGETVLRFEATPAALAPFHRELSLGRLAGVLGALAEARPGLVLGEYLETREIGKARSFGTSLALGDWTVGGTFTVESRWREQSNRVDRSRRVAFDGRQGYHSRWLAAEEDYALELSAAMAGFAAEPAGADFAFAWNLSWAWHDEAGPRLLHTFFDVAAVWGLAGIDRAAAGGLSGPVRATLELKVSDAGVRRLVQIAEADFRAAWTRAMAEALPPVYLGPGVDLVLRASPGDRRRLYGEAARFVLGQPAGTDTVVGLAYAPGPERNRLEPIDLRLSSGAGNEAARFEHLNLWTLWRPTPADANTRNHPAGRCTRVWDEIRRLGDVVDGRRPYQEIGAAFHELDLAVRQPFLARLAGSVLAQLLGAKNEHATVTGRIVPDAGGKAIVLG